jgi:hypothetical protein
MSVFQVLLLIVAAGLFVGSLVAMARGWATRREGTISALIWLLAALAIIWPDVTTRIARAVGLGRGLNLLVYCTVLVTIVGFFMVYIRLRKLRRQLTLLVRHLAILEAQEGPPLGQAPQTQAEPAD